MIDCVLFIKNYSLPNHKNDNLHLFIFNETKISIN